jgi:hypothetical protein
MEREGIVPRHIKLLAMWTESMRNALDSRQADTPSWDLFDELTLPAEHAAAGIDGHDPQDDFTHPKPRAELKSLAEEIRLDSHAARIRDYGAEDAATYDQRVQEGARMPITDWPAEFGRMRGESAGLASDSQAAFDAVSRQGSNRAKEKGPER